jgi:hypothetical protein
MVLVITTDSPKIFRARRSAEIDVARRLDHVLDVSFVVFDTLRRHSVPPICEVAAPYVMPAVSWVS